MNLYKYESYKNLIESKKTGEGKIIELKEYILPKKMYDTEIQKELNSKPIPVNDFLVTLPKFLKTTDKIKSYIFHVDNGESVVAVFVFRDGDEWNVNVFELDYYYRWFGGFSFFSPATDPKELGDLETRVEELEEVVDKLRKFLII